MVSKRLDSGSVEGVIIAVLVVALVGVLGWVFWTNLNGQTKSDSMQSSASTKEDDNKKTATSLEVYENSYFSISLPKGVTASEAEIDGAAVYTDLMHDKLQFSGSIAVYKGSYVKSCECIPPTAEYIPVQEWYSGRGSETQAGVSDDSLVKYDYILAKERGQTTSAAIYIMKNKDMLYKVSLQIDGTNVAYDEGDNLKLSQDVLNALRSFKIK